MRKRSVLMILAMVGALTLWVGCYIVGTAPGPTVEAAVAVPPPPTVVAPPPPTVVVPPPPTVVAPPPPTVVAPRPATGVTVSLPSLSLVAGATILESVCNPGAPEVLNGIDDNCNGQIDEGWVRSGSLQITLGWNTPADIDLYVLDPSGAEIHYADTESPTGGFLDRDARGACEDGEVVENVYWVAQPPVGRYIVRVHYYDDCGAAGPTPVIVSISYNGQIVGAYQYVLMPDQTVEMASFTL